MGRDNIHYSGKPHSQNQLNLAARSGGGAVLCDYRPMLRMGASAPTSRVHALLGVHFIKKFQCAKALLIAITKPYCFSF